MKSSDQLVRDDYRCFNERRIVTAGTLFAPDAVVDVPPSCYALGSA